MAFGIANYEQLPWYIQVALEDMEVRMQRLLRNVANPDTVTNEPSPVEVIEGHHWRKGPWLLDDKRAAEPNVVGLRPPKLSTGTYHNYEPQGIDDAVILELEPDGGDVTLTGIKAGNGLLKRFLFLRNRDSSRSLTLAHLNTGSLTPYRFDLPGGLDLTMGPNQNTWLYYDPARSAWVCTVTPNQAGGLGAANPWTRVVKEADESIVSDDTLSNDAELLFTMAASTKYHIRGALFFTAHGAADTKFSFATPASPTRAIFRTETVLDAGVDVLGTCATTTAPIVVLNGTLAAYDYAGFDVIVETDAGGTFAVTWAQNVNNGNATTLARGSYFEYMTY